MLGVGKLGSHEAAKARRTDEMPAMHRTVEKRAHPVESPERSVLAPAPSPFSNQVDPRVSPTDADFGNNPQRTNLRETAPSADAILRDVSLFSNRSRRSVPLQGEGDVNCGFGDCLMCLKTHS